MMILVSMISPEFHSRKYWKGRKPLCWASEKVSLEEEEINDDNDDDDDEDDGDEGEEDAIISTAKSKKNKSQALGSSCTIDTTPNLAAAGNATTVQ